jgi:hypothetical protein
MSDFSIVTGLSFNDDEIRTTNDGRISLFDFIRVVGGQKSPHEVWKRLCEQYPEYSHILSDYSFGGKGGAAKKTIVITKEETLQILGTLPGVAGKKYRQEAAKLVLAFLDAPEELAVAAFDRITDKKKIAQTQARIDGIAARKLETNAFQESGLVTQGWQYGSLTNATYEGLLGSDAKTLKIEMGLKAKESLRDNLDDVSLAAIRLSELVAAKKAASASTFNQLRTLTYQQAQKVRIAIN